MCQCIVTHFDSPHILCCNGWFFCLFGLPFYALYTCTLFLYRLASFLLFICRSYTTDAQKSVDNALLITGKTGRRKEKLAQKWKLLSLFLVRKKFNWNGDKRVRARIWLSLCMVRLLSKSGMIYSESSYGAGILLAISREENAEAVQDLQRGAVISSAKNSLE